MHYDISIHKQNKDMTSSLEEISADVDMFHTEECDEEQIQFSPNMITAN